MKRRYINGIGLDRLAEANGSELESGVESGLLHYVYSYLWTSQDFF